MATSQHHEKTGKEKFLESFSGFLYNNRILLISILSVLVAGLIILGVTVSVRQKRDERAAAMAEEIQNHYEEWIDLSGEEEAEKKEELKGLILDLAEEVVSSYPKTFGAQRGLLTAAELSYQDESWEDAASYGMRLYRSYPDSYMAPVALATASAAYENADTPEDALDAAEIITAEYSDSLEAPRAFFTVGRLREGQDDTTKALEAYRELVGKFPESSWTKLAQDRIIVLEPEE